MNRIRSSLSVSVRRHFIDNFFFGQAEVFKKAGKIIDIGGKKKNKRGLFDISDYASDVTYVNIDKTTEPDIVSDAASIPLPDNSFSAVILGEVLEHVPEPLSVLREARRLLIPEGKIVATVPFMVGVHGDPHDYGRYTKTFFEKAARDLGFSKIEISEQGTMFAVIALMVQHLFRAKNISWRPIQTPLVKFLMWLDQKTTTPILCAWTTGYGIVLTK